MTRARDLADQADGIIVGDLNVDGGTIKLDGNYPVGTGNVALGDAALDSNVSGGSNVAIGANALTANTADLNTAVGYQALKENTTGTNNVAIGASSLDANTTASNNVAVGIWTLTENTTGANNVAIGREALQANTTASNNTAVGYQAGYVNNTGQYNTFLGYKSGLNNVTSSSSTYVGTFSGELGTGLFNTYVGDSSGYAITTGTRNSILGRYNGNQGGLDIRTSSNNIVLSDGDGNPRIYVSSSGCVSIGTVSATTDTVSRFGGSSSLYSQKMVNAYGGGTAIYADNTNNQGWIYARFNTNGSQVGAISVGTSSTSYVTSSDYRLKENVVYDWDATTRLKQLKPARFNFIVDADTTVDGFLAHEAQAVVPECVTGTKDAVDEDGVAVMQGIDQSKLVPLLVKTIQELEARITALEGN